MKIVYPLITVAVIIFALDKGVDGCIKLFNCDPGTSNKVYHHGNVDIEKATNNMDKAADKIATGRAEGRYPDQRSTFRSTNGRSRDHYFENGRGEGITRKQLDRFDQSENRLNSVLP